MKELNDMINRMYGRTPEQEAEDLEKTLKHTAKTRGVSIEQVIKEMEEFGNDFDGSFGPVKIQRVKGD